MRTFNVHHDLLMMALGVPTSDGRGITPASLLHLQLDLKEGQLQPVMKAHSFQHQMVELNFRCYSRKLWRTNPLPGPKWSNLNSS